MRNSSKGTFVPRYNKGKDDTDIGDLIQYGLLGFFGYNLLKGFRKNGTTGNPQVDAQIQDKINEAETTGQPVTTFKSEQTTMPDGTKGQNSFQDNSATPGQTPPQQQPGYDANGNPVRGDAQRLFNAQRAAVNTSAKYSPPGSDNPLNQNNTGQLNIFSGDTRLSGNNVYNQVAGPQQYPQGTTGTPYGPQGQFQYQGDNKWRGTTQSQAQATTPDNPMQRMIGSQAQATTPDNPSQRLIRTQNSEYVPPQSQTMTMRPFAPVSTPDNPMQTMTGSARQMRFAQARQRLQQQQNQGVNVNGRSGSAPVLGGGPQSIQPTGGSSAFQQAVAASGTPGGNQQVPGTGVQTGPNAPFQQRVQQLQNNIPQAPPVAPNPAVAGAGGAPAQPLPTTPPLTGGAPRVASPAWGMRVPRYANGVERTDSFAYQGDGNGGDPVYNKGIEFYNRANGGYVPRYDDGGRKAAMGIGIPLGGAAAIGGGVKAYEKYKAWKQSQVEEALLRNAGIERAPVAVPYVPPAAVVTPVTSSGLPIPPVANGGYVRRYKDGGNDKLYAGIGGALGGGALALGSYGLGLDFSLGGDAGYGVDPATPGFFLREGSVLGPSTDAMNNRFLAFQQANGQPGPDGRPHLTAGDRRRLARSLSRNSAPGSLSDDPSDNFNYYADGGSVRRYDDGGDDNTPLIAGGAALGGAALLGGGIAYGGGVRFSPGGETPFNVPDATPGFYTKTDSLFGPSSNEMAKRVASHDNKAWGKPISKADARRIAADARETGGNTKSDAVNDEEYYYYADGGYVDRYEDGGFYGGNRIGSIYHKKYFESLKGGTPYMRSINRGLNVPSYSNGTSSDDIKTWGIGGGVVGGIAGGVIGSKMGSPVGGVALGAAGGAAAGAGAKMYTSYKDNH